MAGSATDYLEAALLGHSLGIAPYAMPATLWVGLCTVAPTDSAPGSPPSAGMGYARVAIAFVLGVGQPINAANVASVDFAAATGNWGTVGWFELWDAPNAGNRLYWGQLVDPSDGITPLTRTVMQGDIIRVPVGSLVIDAD